MSDTSRLSESTVVNRNSADDSGQLLGMLMLWAGPLTVFAMALFMAR